MSEEIFIPSFINKMTNVFKVVEESETAVAEDDLKIKVNRVISKVAFIYEKLRNVVDYNDEHLLRKNAIFRILKRLIAIEKRKENLGLALIQELIRINYLPNNTIPESRAKDLDSALNKYLALGFLISRRYKSRSAVKLFFWFLQIASCEIEELLFDFRQRKALTVAMVKALKRDIELPSSINEKNQNIIFNLTALRSLLKSDEAILHYYLLSELHPNFFNTEPDKKELIELVKNWEKERSKMEYFLFHPLKNKLGKIGKKYAVYFLMLRDALEENHDKIDDLITHPKVLEQEIIQVCSKRYKEIRVKVVRAVIRSIIYIFITKMALALLVEVPLDYMWEQRLNYITLVINILFPPFLMFAISLFIHFPKKKNTEKIVQRVKEIVYQKKEKEKKYHLKPNVVRSKIVNFSFNLFYLVTYGITFGLIVYFLYRLNFNVLSGAIFIFFLCIVSFFAVHIRSIARELIVLDARDSFFNLLIDFFSLPIMRIGQWLSIKLSKINIFVFFMDFIVEAPLKIILEVIEDWLSFVREKKEEIY